MKKILFILILIISGCNDKEDEFTKEQEKREKAYEEREKKEKELRAYSDVILDLNAEKLALLSIIKKTPNDTLRLILKDYINKTGFGMNNSNKIDKIIDAISVKYNISEVKIASIVFSYTYEVLTKDEIEQNAIENYENEKQNEYQEH